MNVVVKYNIHAESPYHEYRKSVHGRGLYDKGLLDFAAVCTDCHGVHNIQGVGPPPLPATSPTCHARPEIMKKYGVPEDRIRTFIESFHGIAIGLGGTAEASCVDCPCVPDILPAAGPHSR